MIAALIFGPNGSFNYVQNLDISCLSTIFQETTVITIDPCFSDKLNRAVIAGIGQDILSGKKSIWSRIIYNKGSGDPWINPIIHEILQEVYGDVGEIFGYVYLVE